MISTPAHIKHSHSTHQMTSNYNMIIQVKLNVITYQRAVIPTRHVKKMFTAKKLI